MKILLLSTYDSHGGAARAAFRLCTGLRSAGHEAKMLVQAKEGDADFVQQPRHFSYHFPFNKFRGYFDLLKPVLITRKKILFSSAILPSKSVLKAIREEAPDIVHMHWISKGFIQLKSLKEIKQPVVWTLHDMWAFTGGCHNSGDCQKYMNNCGACPILHSGKESDLSRKLYNLKRSAYQELENIRLITPSSWMANNVKSSSLLGKFDLTIIPNSIDTQVFRPVNVVDARQKLNLPLNKRIILFIAVNVDDKLKGFDYLLRALELINDKKDIYVVVVGRTRSEKIAGSGPEIKYFELISDMAKLALLYNAADLTVNPSLQENLPNNIMESLACGTPVVAFSTGGIPDMIDHKKNGYLAEYKSVGDLSNGIKWCLYDADAQALSDNARQKVLDEFAEEVVIQKHVKLYQEMLNK